MEISIPVSRLSENEIKETQVFFGVIHGMVLIYIPHIFFHLIDGSKHHEIYSSVFLTDKEEFSGSPFIPGQITRLHCQVSTKEEEVYLILDGKTGIFYDIYIGRPWVVRQFSQRFMGKHLEWSWTSSEQLIRALHLAMFHISEGDDELFIQIISLILFGGRDSPYELIDKDILKEIIICYVYLQVQKIKSYSDLLLIIPMTSMPPLLDWCHEGVTVSKSSRIQTVNSHLVPRINPNQMNPLPLSKNKSNEKGGFLEQFPPAAHIILQTVAKHLEKHMAMEKKNSNRIAVSYCYLIVSKVIYFRKYEY